MWREIADVKGYEVNQEGEFRHARSGNPIKQGRDGSIGLGKRMYRAFRLILKTWKPELTPQDPSQYAAYSEDGTWHSDKLFWIPLTEVTRGGRPMKVTDASGNSTRYKSIKEAAEKLKVHVSSVNTSLLFKEPMVRKGFSFEDAVVPGEESELRDITAGPLQGCHVSSCGLLFINGRWRKGQQVSTGSVVRVNDGTKKNIRVDRVIAQLFLGLPPKEDMVVGHVDGNMNNNRVDNLTWTEKYRTPSKGAIRCSNDDEVVRTFESQIQAARWLVQEGKTKSENSGKVTISRACKTEKKALGFFWERL